MGIRRSLGGDGDLDRPPGHAGGRRGLGAGSPAGAACRRGRPACGLALCVIDDPAGPGGRAGHGSRGDLPGDDPVGACIRGPRGSVGGECGTGGTEEPGDFGARGDIGGQAENSGAIPRCEPGGDRGSPARRRRGTCGRRRVRIGRPAPNRPSRPERRSARVHPVRRPRDPRDLADRRRHVRGAVDPRDAAARLPAPIGTADPGRGVGKHAGGSPVGRGNRPAPGNPCLPSHRRARGPGRAQAGGHPARGLPRQYRRGGPARHPDPRVRPYRPPRSDGRAGPAGRRADLLAAPDGAPPEPQAVPHPRGSLRRHRPVAG